MINFQSIVGKMINSSITIRSSSASSQFTPTSPSSLPSFPTPSPSTPSFTSLSTSNYHLSPQVQLRSYSTIISPYGIMISPSYSPLTLPEGVKA